MAGGILAITYEVNFTPIELVDDRDWREAITGRRIRRETPVTVYRTGEPPRVERAEDVPELGPLFDEIDPPAPVAPPLESEAVEAAEPPGPPQSDAPEGEPDGELSADAPDQAATAASQDETPPFVPAGEQVPPPPPGPGPDWRPLAAVGAVFALLILGLSLIPSNRSAPVNVSEEIVPDLSNMAMEDMGTPASETGNDSDLDMTAPSNAMDTNMIGDNQMMENATASVDPYANTVADTVATTTRPLYVINRCHYYIDLWARYHHPDYGWRTAGPRRLNTGKSLDLYSDQADFYYYAQAPDTTVRWASAGVTAYYGTQSMRPVSAALNSRGSYYLELTCEGR